MEQEPVHCEGMKPQPPKLGELVEISYCAEREAMYFYTGLANRFRHLKEISDFWLDMADDEDLHVDIVDMLRTTLSDDDLARPVDAELMSKVQGFLKFNAKGALAGIHNLDDAYKFSVNLEYSELNKMLELLVNDNMAEQEEKERIVKLLYEHQGRLKTFSSLFGDAIWRREIKALEPDSADWKQTQ